MCMKSGSFSELEAAARTKADQDAECIVKVTDDNGWEYERREHDHYDNHTREE
jgi:hypothetical protein